MPPSNRSSSSSREQEPLVMSMADLNRESRNYDTESYQFATAEQAFFDQSLHSFVADEVHSMLQILCCENRTCATLWNPLYLLLWLLLFLLTLPGAFLHWLLLDFIPVRSREYPEERELRSQGLYVAVGIACYCIPLAIVGAVTASRMVAVISGLSVLVNVSLICFMLTALRVIAQELHHSARLFVLGIWSITIILAGLLLFDVASYLSTSVATIMAYLLRVLQVIVYICISTQITQFWNMYAAKSSSTTRATIATTATAASIRSHSRRSSEDCTTGFVLLLLWLAILLALCSVLIISRSDAWRLFLF